MKLIDLAGHRFGRLTVIKKDKPLKKATRWICQCDCGTATSMRSKHLRGGKTRSCGCLRIETAAKTNRTHGLSKSKEYTTWVLIKDRCYNINSPNYKYYGGRGITICSKWRNSFIAFYEDMGKRPSNDYSIDRIDNDGPYSPANCRWATRMEQGNNSRRNKMIEFNGETKTMAQWARDLGMSYHLIRGRFNCGWSVEAALTTKPMNRFGR